MHRRIDKDVVIVSGCRIAQTKFTGDLKVVRADELATLVMKEAIKRAGISPDQINEVIFGQVFQTTEALNIARFAAFGAEIPVEVPASTIHLQCTSSLEAICLGAKAILMDEAEVVLAGGVENMSRMPFISYNHRYGARIGDSTLTDTFVEGGYSCSSYYFGRFNMGNTAENLVREYGFTRQQLDEISLRSHQLAVAAIREGRFKEEIVPVVVPQKRGEPLVIDTDQHPRADTTLESMAKLPPYYEKDGTVTAASSSGINDGAAAVILMSDQKAKHMGITPFVKILSWAKSAVHPSVMGKGPISATKKALEKAGMTVGDIDLWEINEAFAPVLLAIVKELGLDMARVNVNGGAIALGHPVGCSGARLMVTLMHEMKRRGAKYGIDTLCAGGGQGVATVVQLWDEA
ncbi:MAG: acetyl-CoA C-acetyltransferase [Desulfobacteraceae bacterium]|jgi:acetyl-CoA C-acetyltransferase